MSFNDYHSVIVTKLFETLLLDTRNPKVIWEEATAPQTPDWLQWGTPHLPTLLPLPMDRSLNPTTCLIPGPI